MRKENTEAASGDDRFVTAFEKALAFGRANRDKVILGLATGLLLLAILSGVGLYRQKADREASLALQGLKADFQALVAREGREAALAPWLAEAPAALKGVKGRASYGAALLWYGALAFEHKAFQSAAEWYGIAAGEFAPGSSLRNIAWCGQGQALEQQGHMAEASALYEKIRTSESSVKQSEATFLLARIKEAQGDPKGAGELYRELVESPADSIYKALAAEKITAP